MERNSNIELLRIICMLLIIMHHFNIHTVFVDNYVSSSLTFLIHMFCLNWGETAVLVFVMITGYYSIEQSSLKIRKIIRLILEVVFYSVIITSLSIATGIIEFDWYRCIEMIFPIISSSYWFFTYYLVLLLLAPFLNYVLTNITKNQYFFVICILSFVTIGCRIMPSAPMISSSYLISFILAYSISGYFKLYPSSITTNKHTGFCLLIFCIIFIFIFDWALIDTCYGVMPENDPNYFPLLIFIILIVVSLFVVLFTNIVKNKVRTLVIMLIIYYFIAIVVETYTRRWDTIYEFTRPDCGFCMIAAIGLFLLFKNKTYFSNRLINWVAASTFSVYLIHDSNCLRYWIWNDVVCANEILSMPAYYFVSVMVVWTIIIFTVCVLIDKVKEVIICNNVSNLIEDFSKWVEKRLKLASEE